MQEQNEAKEEKKRKKIGKWDIVFMSLFGMVVLGVLGLLYYTYRHIPLSEWREYSSKFPIQGIDLKLESIQAEWHNAKGNARMELRTAYYPSATLTLGGGNGTGMIYVRFMNHQKVQQGHLVALPYRDGKFVAQKDAIIRAEGNTATVLLEGGFSDPADYTLHRLNEQEKLWRVYVWQRPDNTQNTYLLGYKTISVTP